LSTEDHQTHHYRLKEQDEDKVGMMTVGITVGAVSSQVLDIKVVTVDRIGRQYALDLSLFVLVISSDTAYYLFIGRLTGGYLNI
jgi:hypothetical protein